SGSENRYEMSALVSFQCASVEEGTKLELSSKNKVYFLESQIMGSKKDTQKREGEPEEVFISTSENGDLWVFFKIWVMVVAA
uniref:Uncharacterized protein n=1 Tax=Poecilia formosa TaxID=48698 RepID=A0A096LUB0_POEFO